MIPEAPEAEVDRDRDANSSTNLIDKAQTFQRAMRCTVVVVEKTKKSSESETPKKKRPTLSMSSSTTSTSLSSKKVITKSTEKIQMFKFSHALKPSLSATRV